MPEASATLQFSHAPKVLDTGLHQKPRSAPGFAGPVQFLGGGEPEKRLLPVFVPGFRPATQITGVGSANYLVGVEAPPNLSEVGKKFLTRCTDKECPSILVLAWIRSLPTYLKVFPHSETYLKTVAIRRTQIKF